MRRRLSDDLLSLFDSLDIAELPAEIDDDDISEEELSDALFSMYCTALTMYSRTQALLIMMHMTSGERIFKAVEMHSLGYSSQHIANELDSTHTTILRWMKRSLPRRPEWLDEALEELQEYTPEELRAELEAAEWQAWTGSVFRPRARIVSSIQVWMFDSEAE
jgi:hypothetical protein